MARAEGKEVGPAVGIGLNREERDGSQWLDGRNVRARAAARRGRNNGW